MARKRMTPKEAAQLLELRSLADDDSDADEELDCQSEEDHEASKRDISSELDQDQIDDFEVDNIQVAVDRVVSISASEQGGRVFPEDDPGLDKSSKAGLILLYFVLLLVFVFY